jgi:hypothetical protein
MEKLHNIHIILVTTYHKIPVNTIELNNSWLSIWPKRYNAGLTDTFHPGFCSFPTAGEPLILRGTTTHSNLNGCWYKCLIVEISWCWIHGGTVYGVIQRSYVGHTYKLNHRTTFNLVDEVNSSVYVTYKDRWWVICDVLINESTNEVYLQSYNKMEFKHHTKILFYYQWIFHWGGLV